MRERLWKFNLPVRILFYAIVGFLCLLSQLVAFFLETALFGGILAASLGISATLILLRAWERKLQRSFELTAKEKALPATDHDLILKMEELQSEYERFREEALLLEKEWQTKLIHKESLLADYKRTITEQRGVIGKKQRYISKLEEKVQDLLYEIRQLLHIENPPLHLPEAVVDTPPEDMDLFLLNSPQESSSYDFSKQLHRYIRLAETFTGVSHLGYVGGKTPRFLDLSWDSYAIDLRRLFDSFREETVGIVFIYSKGEDKFLFVNNMVKSLLGWGAEKFMKDFHILIEMGASEWKKALEHVVSMKECQFNMSLQNKIGDELLFQCFLGYIAQGPFTSHLIGMLIPA